MRDHPCFNCRLPDCDDASRHCALKAAIRKYHYAMTNHQPVTDDIRADYKIAHHELYGIEQLEKRRERRHAGAS